MILTMRSDLDGKDIIDEFDVMAAKETLQKEWSQLKEEVDLFLGIVNITALAHFHSGNN